MKKSIILNVNKPCYENFNDFLPTKIGGFCKVCQTEVRDFTKMNETEIVNYFSKKPSNDLCGRFYQSQLTIPATISKNRFNLSFFTGMGLAILSFFSTLTIQAQEIKKISKDNNSLQIKQLNNIEVVGNVTSDNFPLPGTSVYLEGTNIGTETDFDGNFVFPEKLKIGDVLLFSYVGMKSQRVVIQSDNSKTTLNLQIKMQSDVVLMGKVMVKEVYSSKKNR